MFLAVWTFLAIAVTTIIYAWLGQGGGVSGLRLLRRDADRRRSSTWLTRPEPPRLAVVRAPAAA